MPIIQIPPVFLKASFIGHGGLCLTNQFYWTWWSVFNQPVLLDMVGPCLTNQFYWTWFRKLVALYLFKKCNNTIGGIEQNS